MRGAPALGVAGAFGVALAARHADDGDAADVVRRVETARPTAVNLARGARRAAARLPEGADAVLAEAIALRDEEIAASAAMATRGADLFAELCGPRPRLLTHCNTGGLAAVVGGTALGVLAEMHRRGALGGVDRQRDPAAAAGRPADRVGARPARRRLPGRGRRRRARS